MRSQTMLGFRKIIFSVLLNYAVFLYNVTVYYKHKDAGMIVKLNKEIR